MIQCANTPCTSHIILCVPTRGTAGCHCHCQGHPTNPPHHCCPTLNANLCQSFPAPLIPMAFLNMPTVDIKVLLPQQNTNRSKASSKPRCHSGQGVKPSSFHSLSQPSSMEFLRNQHQISYHPTKI